MTFELDFRKAVTNPRDKLLKRYSEIEIYSFLLGYSQTDMFNPNVNHISTIRPKINPDTRPSLTFSEAKDGRLIFSDWGIGKFGDVFDYILFYYENKTNSSLDQTRSVAMFVDEYSKYKIKDLNIQSVPIITNEKRNYAYVIEPLTASDVNYWKSYGIIMDVLMIFKVKRVRLLYDEDTGITLSKNTYSNPIYAYTKLGESETSFQIYRPFADKYSKFRNIFKDKNIIFGEHFLKGSNDLIITKSMKDVMSMYGRAVDVVGIPSEALTIPRDKISEWKSKYKNIYLLFDNDDAGKDHSFHLCSLYNIKPLFVPEVISNSLEKKPKDFSDFYKYDPVLAEKFLNNFS